MANAIYAKASTLVNSSFTVAVQAGNGTEDTGYEAMHLTDWTSPETQHQPAKLTTTYGAWVLSAAAAVQVELAVLWLHNFDDDIDVRLDAHTADNWAAPTWTKAFTIPAAWADGRRAPVFLDLRTEDPGTTGYRFYRLAIGDGSPQNSVALAAKLLLFSACEDLPGLNFELEHAPAYVFRTDILRTDLGFRADVLDHQILRRSWRGSVVVDGAADRALIEDWYRDAHGSASPVVWVPDPDVNDAWVCEFVGLSVEPMTNAATRIGLDLAELAPGAPL